MKTNRMITDFLLKETARRRKKERKDIEMIRKQLEQLAMRVQIRGPSTEIETTRQRLMKRIYELEHPEVKSFPTAKAAVKMSDLSDRGTKPFYKNFKAAKKQQWINKLKIGDWIDKDREPKRPT